MFLTHPLLTPILNALDRKLSNLKEPRELVICGGAALLILDITERQTRDVDVITPTLDPLLKEVAEQVGKQFGLESAWLNNGPEALSKDLESGWEARTQEIYKGKFLKIKSLSRSDLIASKLFAFCDRDENDLDDLLHLKPTLKEIDSLKSWILARDTSELWPARVQKCLKKLKSRLGYEKS